MHNRPDLPRIRWTQRSGGDGMEFGPVVDISCIFFSPPLLKIVADPAQN